MASADEVLRWFYTKKASGRTGLPSPADYYKGQLFAEAGNMQNKRRNELDRANLSTAQQAVDAQRAFNNQSLADAELNRQAQEKAQQMQTLTSLGSAAATAYGLSGSTMIGDAVKTGVQTVAPSVAKYLGLQTAAQKAASSIAPKLAGEAVKGAASSVGSTVGNVAGKVAVPLAIIGAANMARNQWGEPERKWYGEDSKTASAKFFDDPGMGLGANISDAIFGSDSEWSRVPNQVGEQFSHYAGGPIGKAFNLDFKGAASELSNAPSTTLQSFGVDKGTSEAANAILNSPGYAYSQWAEGNSQPGLNFLGAPDPITGAVSTALSNSGLGTVGNIASAVLNPVGAVVSLFCFALNTPMQMADGKEVPVQDLDLLDTMLEGGNVMANGKALSDNIYSYKGILVEGHHAVFADGEWKRIYDCPEAKFHGSGVVYPIVNENHLIIVDGIVFADMIETPLGWDVSDKERIDWLNLQTKRNALLKERYDNSSISETEALRDDVQVVG